MLSNFFLICPVNYPSTPTSVLSPGLVDDCHLGKLPTQLEWTVEFSSGTWTHDNSCLLLN